MKIFTLIFFFTTFSYSQISESGQDKLYDLHVELGMSLYKHYQTDSLNKIMKNFQTAIEMRPKEPFAFEMRGFIKEELGDFRGAMRDFNKCILNDPEYIDCYNSRALLKGSLKDWKGAALDFEKVLELFKKRNIDTFGIIEYADIVYNIAVCKLNSGELEAACILFSKAGELGKFQAYTEIQKHCN